MKKRSLTLYGVCDDDNGGPFNPLSTQHESKREALAGFRILREDHPERYLVQITYTRVPVAQKGGRR